MSFGVVGLVVLETIIKWGSHRRHLANTVKRLCAAAVSGFVIKCGNAASFQIIFGYRYFIYS